MEGVTEIQGKVPGKTVAIFGGIHGNERVGVEALRQLAATLTLDAGTLYLVEGNPAAIAEGVRQIGKNLNRCFIKGNDGVASEDVRARELMQLLDQCDALLDLHASNSKKSVPFIVCEKEAFPIAQKLAFPIVSPGWDAIEPGASDGYMHRSGKPALCLECGYAEDFAAHVTLAVDSMKQFLGHYGLLRAVPEPFVGTQQVIEAYRAVLKKSDALSFAREYADFEPLSEGEVFAHDGDESYVAAKNDCIVFPRKDGVIGSEAFILARRLS